MRTVEGLAWVTFVLSAAVPAHAATYYVAQAPTGSDSAAGTEAKPWATLQHAADQVAAGDTVEVAYGTYAGFTLETSGAEPKRIVFHTDGALIDEGSAKSEDGIFLDGVSYVTIDGFTVSKVKGNGIHLRNGKFVYVQRSAALQCGLFGFAVSAVDDVALIANEASANPGPWGINVDASERPVIRGNYLHDNSHGGISVWSTSADGITSGATIEQNLVFHHGKEPAVECRSVQDSYIWNNFVYDNDGYGIWLTQQGVGQGSKRNRVFNNTIVGTLKGDAPLRFEHGSTDNIVGNNVLLARNPARASVDISATSFPITSDYNIVVNRFANEDVVKTLTDWRALTGQDEHSFLATEAELFEAAPSGDYRLLANAPLIDRGTDVYAPSFDLLGKIRPQGAAFDIGAYETAPVTSAGEGGAGGEAAAGASSTDGGASVGGDTTGVPGGAAAGAETSVAGEGNEPSGGNSSTGGKSSAGGRSASAGKSASAGEPGEGFAGKGIDKGDLGNDNDRDDGGCGCNVVGDARAQGLGWLLMGALVLGLRKRVRR